MGRGRRRRRARDASDDAIAAAIPSARMAKKRSAEAEKPVASREQMQRWVTRLTWAGVAVLAVWFVVRQASDLRRYVEADGDAGGAHGDSEGLDSMSNKRRLRSTYCTGGEGKISCGVMHNKNYTRHTDANVQHTAATRSQLASTKSIAASR